MKLSGRCLQFAPSSFGWLHRAHKGRLLEGPDYIAEAVSLKLLWSLGGPQGTDVRVGSTYNAVRNTLCLRMEASIRSQCAIVNADGSRVFRGRSRHVTNFKTLEVLLT